MFKIRYMNIVYHSDALPVLKNIDNESVTLCVIDPPFATGHTQQLQSVKSIRSSEGNKGFGGNTYTNKIVSKASYEDKFDDYVKDFLEPHLIEVKRILTNNGTLCLHLDWRAEHEARVYLDTLFGKDCFVNSLIWSFNFGGRGKRCFPRKHNTILVYSKIPDGHIFNYADVDRIPYKAPSLQKSKERAAAGQIPTDVWELGIVGTNAHERVNYVSQKPEKLVKRLITAFSNKGDTVLDFCAGSGTTGASVVALDRKFILVDRNIEAIETMKKRFSAFDVTYA